MHLVPLCSTMTPSSLPSRAARLRPPSTARRRIAAGHSRACACSTARSRWPARSPRCASAIWAPTSSRSSPSPASGSATSRPAARRGTASTRASSRSTATSAASRSTSRRPRAARSLRELARTADVFLQNYRPGVAERLGVDYETLSALNPDIVYVSISGYGEDGPYAHRPGQDLLLQAMSGALSRPGAPATRRSPPGSSWSTASPPTWRSRARSPRCSTASAPARVSSSRSTCSTPS